MKQIFLSTLLCLTIGIASKSQILEHSGSTNQKFCGKAVSVYKFANNEINGKTFSFFIPQKGCASLPGFKELNFDKCDKFTIEFAGYLDAEKKKPSYFLIRKDGKYLSFKLEGAEFSQRLNNPISQQWVFVKKSTNTYNLIVTFNTMCLYLNTKVENGKYVMPITNFSVVDATYNLNIIIKEVNTNAIPSRTQ